MDHKEIRNYVERVMSELDEPGTYVPVINQYLTKEEDWREDATKILYALPVPESAAVQNLGIAILTNIANDEMSDDYLASVSYFPEVKMWKRMVKNDIPMFDNWLFHPWRDFDVVGISSFYSLQYLNFIQMLERAHIPYKSTDRLDSWDDPIVILGGIQCYSAETVYECFDAFLVGEGEEMNAKFLTLLRQRKAEGVSKREFLLEAAREIQGVYLPWCYEFTYYGPEGDENGNHKNQIKEYHLTDEGKEHGVPLKVLKSAIEFRDRPPVQKTFVSNNSGGSMSIGSCYCANACSNLCSFCQGSIIALPFREVPFDLAKQSARAIIKNTGTKDLSPYCFNVSDLSYVNRFTRDLLLEDRMKVALSSERLDTMDDDFVKATIKSGSRSFTVAIESASPRGRHILNKNLTEEHILRAFEIMFRNGATKIKIYNIASFPFEQEEDRLYYADLMGKIEELRKKYNAKTQIRISFTPFQAKPMSMLQWAAMENVAIDENGDPQFLKTFNNMMDKVKEVCDYRFRFGTASTISLVAQALAFGDRRLWPVVEACAHDSRISYMGGMGAGKELVDVFTEYLRTKTPLNWDYFQREKDEDEIFPWEALHTGVDKSWLLRFYKAAKAASQTPIDEEGYLRRPCYVNCTACGVCVSAERGTPEKPKFEDGYWPEHIFGKGRWLPKFGYGDNTEDKLNMEQVLDDYIKPQKLRVLRLEADINPKFRYVDPEKMKYRIRRAANRAGIPIRTDITSATTKILEKAWFSGKEVFECYSADKRFEMSASEIVDKLNAEFADDALIIRKGEWYSDQVKPLKTNFEYVLYSLTIPAEDFSSSQIASAVDEFMSTKNLEMKIKRKSKEKRDAFETVKLNAWEFCMDCFYKVNDDGTTTLFVALKDDASVYDFATALLKTAKRNLLKYPAVIEEFLLKSDADSFDMFGSYCTECDAEGKETQIEDNIWGEPVDECLCVKHKYLKNFVHRDAVSVAAGFSAEFAEEADEDVDDKFSIGEVTMDDDDTDLEDQVLKKSGNTGV